MFLNSILVNLLFIIIGEWLTGVLSLLHVRPSRESTELEGIQSNLQQVLKQRDDSQQWHHHAEQTDVAELVVGVRKVVERAGIWLPIHSEYEI